MDIYIYIYKYKHTYNYSYILYKCVYVHLVFSTLRMKMPGLQENTYFTSFFSHLPPDPTSIYPLFDFRTSLGVDAIHDEYHNHHLSMGTLFSMGCSGCSTFWTRFHPFFRKNTLQQTPCSPGTIDSLCNQILPDINEGWVLTLKKHSSVFRSTLQLQKQVKKYTFALHKGGSSRIKRQSLINHGLKYPVGTH